MGLFKNLKDTVAGAMTPPSPDQMAALLDQLPPDNRAEVEANMARANQGTADAQAVFESERDQRRSGRVLDGPAGDHLYGRLDDLEGPQDVARRMQQEGAGAVYQDALGATTSGVSEAVFPYLPADPQELLRMYLEVVGVRAADCYGAQVTVHSAQELIGRVLGEGATNVGPKQPCADGKDRGRIHGAEHVVVTYRDSAAYAEGRARWAAYQEEVLLAHLERGTGIREAVWVDDDRDIDNGLLRAGAALLRGADRIAMLVEGRPPPPFRYCWPPID